MSVHQKNNISLDISCLDASFCRQELALGATAGVEYEDGSKVRELSQFIQYNLGPTITEPV